MTANNLKNATLYQNLLRREVDGECIWWPCDLGEVGDCGYIEENGHFVKFFNMFDLPEFGPRPQDQSILRSQTLPNRDVADATAGAAGAFLQPLGDDRVQETYIRSLRFAKYLAKNYKTILEQYGQDCDIQSLLIVKGTVRGSLKLQGGAAPVGVGLATTATHRPQVQWAPRVTDPEAVSTWHTIVIQPVYISFARKLLHTIKSAIGASTIPGTTSPSVEQQGNVPSSAMDQGGSHIIGAGPETGGISGQAPGTCRKLSAPARRLFRNLMSTNPRRQTAIQQLLDRTLELHPELDAIVWEWDTELVHAFEDIMAQSGSIETALEQVLLEFDLMSSTSGQVGIARPYTSNPTEGSGFDRDANLLHQTRPEEFVGDTQSSSSYSGGASKTIGRTTDVVQRIDSVFSDHVQSSKDYLTANTAYKIAQDDAIELRQQTQDEPADYHRQNLGKHDPALYMQTRIQVRPLLSSSYSTALIRQYYGPEMSTSNTIFPVLTTNPYRGSIGGILQLILDVHSSLLDYDEQIDRCFVTHVGHYRSTSHDSHELVALTMDYSLSDGTKERRYLHLDRTSTLQQGQRFFSMLTPFFRAPTSLNDKVSVFISDRLVDDSRGIIGNEYQLVRTFEVRSGTLPIIDALVLADTLSKMVESYTLHIEMCQFWAANLVLILKAVVEYRQNGDIRNIRIVDIDTGKALFGVGRGEMMRLFMLQSIGPIFREKQAEVNKLRATSTGGPIVAEVADQAPVSNDNDLTANTVYRRAQKHAAELRQEIKDKLAVNRWPNAEFAQLRVDPTDEVVKLV
ncbi:hypothetical protein BKA62DRAFT_705378 [Auriculariales sp. MPI-PUGE-AT-0066]|nr:hypothetical protein BKA62DRAFT_705378 [Auriculariales sp. MPI-PUGE-AT-0066]